MFRSRTARWVAFGSLAVLLIGAGVAVAGEGARGGRRQRRAREAWLTREYGRMASEKKGRMLRSLRNLMEAPDDQVKVALEAARDLAKVREAARSKAAAVVVQAYREGSAAAPEGRDAVREATRAKLRAVREEFRPAFTEAGMRVVKALTPDQRKRIEEAVKAKGIAVDDVRLAKWFGLRLSRPWAGALLEARLGGR